MTRVAMSEPGALTTSDVAHADRGLGHTPGIRTARSRGFRMVIAVTLLAVGLVSIGGLLARQASAPDGQFGIDLGDYVVAAQRVAAGATPYAAEMLAGPTDAQGVDRYRYPPLLAQAIAPVADAGLHALALPWLVLQALALFVAVWIGAGIGGARPDLERVLWCAVAALYFLPVFDTLWKGNVSGFLALGAILVALGGAVAGLAAGLSALLKAAPATLLPAVLMMDRRARISAVATILLVTSVSFALAPTAWLDYVTVLRNMLAGSSDFANNLAPGAVVARILGAGAGDLGRVLALGAASIALVASLPIARRPAGRPAAALLGVIALLLLPASLWYHYLALLLPFAALAWPRASIPGRGALLGGAAMVTLGLAWLPLALLGAVVMAVATLVTVWPRPLASSSWVPAA